MKRKFNKVVSVQREVARNLATHPYRKVNAMNLAFFRACERQGIKVQK